MDAKMIGLVALGLVVGAVLGAAYFASLWATTRRLSRSRRPAALVLAGYAVRLLVAAAVFAWMAWTGVAAVLAALVGFIAVRGVAVRRVGAVPREGGS